MFPLIFGKITIGLKLLLSFQIFLPIKVTQISYRIGPGRDFLKMDRKALANFQTFFQEIWQKYAKVISSYVQ